MSHEDNRRLKPFLLLSLLFHKFDKFLQREKAETWVQTTSQDHAEKTDAKRGITIPIYI